MVISLNITFERVCGWKSFPDERSNKVLSNVGGRKCVTKSWEMKKNTKVGVIDAFTTLRIFCVLYQLFFVISFIYIFVWCLSHELNSNGLIVIFDVAIKSRFFAPVANLHKWLAKLLDVCDCKFDFKFIRFK